MTDSIGDGQDVDQETDLQWLIAKYDSIAPLLQESTILRHMKQNARYGGYNEGFSEAYEKGREEGCVKSLQWAIEEIIIQRFPDLSHFAHLQLPLISNAELLQELVLQMCVTPEATEAERSLQEAVKSMGE